MDSENNLSDITETIHVSGKNELDNQNHSSCNKIRLFLKFFTVEPIWVLYVLPNVVCATVTNHFNMRKACQVDLNYSESLCEKVADRDSNDNNTNINQPFVASQKLVANMTSWSLPLQYGIPLITILLIGAWSDRTGNRKILMMLPLLGELMCTVGKIFATYYFSEWSLWVIGLVDCLPRAFSGGFSVMAMSTYSYIADITSTESRTFKMGLVGVISSVAQPFGSAVSGISLRVLGYYGVFGSAVALYSTGIIYTLIRIKDVKCVKTERNFMTQVVMFFHPRNFWDTLSVLFKNHGSQLLQVIMIIVTHVVIVGPIFGETPVLYLYVTNKFSMDLVEYSLFTTYTVVITSVGTATAITVFCKWLKIHDTILGIIGAASNVISNFVSGLAQTKPLFYAGPALNFFGGTAALAVRSLGTKIVGQHDIGKFCSILGLVEGIGPIVYTPLYSQIYSKTLETTPGAFYVVGAAMTSPSIFIFIFLYFMNKRKLKHENHSGVKDLYSNNNDVTYL